ncbi:MAG: tetratricopeptide repeat protein [Candidatus Obscuribacter sp.]|nr:tetratricopeptide repeat protein [Candidatus Obscuribacter sp.]MBP6591863.1 tetratricopeptide repeat protein [Candidatus Obscuribacter sp.]MBP7577390.1 tetratricopeptide repeat protein [Candidatus Obscuribacter sp.]
MQLRLSLLIAPCLALFAFAASASTEAVDSKRLATAAASTSVLKGESKNQIDQLVRQGRYQDALDALDKLTDSRDYLVHAYRAYLYSHVKPLVYSLPAAKLAVKLKGGSALCHTNLGILLQRNGQRAEAVEQYRQAINIDPTDWRPHVGIAQCLGVDGADGKQIAERELKSASATPGQDSSKWTSIGTTMIVLRQYKEAAVVFNRLLALSPDDARTRSLYVKCLLHLQGNVASALVESVVSSELGDKELAVLIAALPQGRISETKQSELLTICQTNFANDDNLFYDLARAFERVGRDDLGQSAYLTALKIAPTSSRYILSLIGNRLKAKDHQGALDYIKTYVPAEHLASGGIKTTKRYKDSFAHTLALLPMVVGEGQVQKLHILKAVYHHLNCGCRIPVIEFRLRNLNGVVFAGMLDLTEPPLTVIYDSTLAKPDTIISTAKREDDVIELLSDDVVESLPDVIRLIQTASDKPDKHIYTIWSFEPPPMELP